MNFCEIIPQNAQALDLFLHRIDYKPATNWCRHDSWSSFSTYSVWQTLLGVTRKLGRDHGVLSELLSNHVSNQLSDLVEDVQRVYKKVLIFSNQFVLSGKNR